MQGAEEFDPAGAFALPQFAPEAPVPLPPQKCKRRRIRPRVPVNGPIAGAEPRFQAFAEKLFHEVFAGAGIEIAEG